MNQGTKIKILYMNPIIHYPLIRDLKTMLHRTNPMMLDLLYLIYKIFFFVGFYPLIFKGALFIIKNFKIIKFHLINIFHLLYLVLKYDYN